jgi:hypothetical protein
MKPKKKCDVCEDQPGTQPDDAEEQDPEVFLYFDWEGRDSTVLRKVTILKQPLPVGSKYHESEIGFVVTEVEFWERSGVHLASEHYNRPCYSMSVKPIEFDSDIHEDPPYDDWSEWTSCGWVVEIRD